MRQFFAAAAALVLIALAVPVSAQTAATADEDAIRAVVKKLFDGMRARDTVMMKSAFAAEARFFGLGRDNTVTVTTPSEFFASIGRAPAGLVLDEVLHDIEVRVDGPLATVWTYYDFFAGENFSHCGYDAMQLLKLGTEWKIVALADSRRREGCRQKRG